MLVCLALWKEKIQLDYQEFKLPLLIYIYSEDSKGNKIPLSYFIVEIFLDSVELIKEAEVIKSSVGYESVCKIIKQLTDVDVSVNRELTKMEDDYAIVGLTLPFRLTSKSKGRRNDPTPDDYIYFIASHAKIS